MARQSGYNRWEAKRREFNRMQASGELPTMVAALKYIKASYKLVDGKVLSGSLQVGKNGKLCILNEGVQTVLSTSRVAWALHYGSWPSHQIEFINGDRLDTRVENMRLGKRAVKSS